jgi:hypothetical protein
MGDLVVGSQIDDATDAETAERGDPVSVELGDLQFTLGEGPCVDAFARRRPVLIPVLDETVARWPAYTPEAHRRGVRAVFAFPIQIGAVRLGVLDFYRTDPGRLADAALQQAFAFADVARDALLDEHQQVGTEKLAASVYDASGRAELYQAQGMVMIALGVDLVEAMIRLRAYAYANDRALNDVARDVVAGTLQIENDDPRAVDGEDVHDADR